MKSLRARWRELARQRVDILLENAIKNATIDMNLAQRQAQIARRICMKYNLRLPYEKRQLFCRGCKRFIIPGLNARVRLSRKIKAVVITCMECGHVYHKILST
ncbi:MAG: RNase P subunit [Nitrososphaerota archaeon]|nr:RNase P subunit [Nitrososphaerales archaeon]MDW8044594.1 RNase P subunit [Nitrososphaerota archaeon]